MGKGFVIIGDLGKESEKEKIMIWLNFFVEMNVF